MESYGLTRATADAAITRELPHLHLDGNVDMDGIDAVIDIQRELGAVTGPLPGPKGRIELRGRVVRSMPEGALRRVAVDCGVPLGALMPGERHAPLAAGDDVSVSFAADAAHVMAPLSKDATSR